jgi:hypothetical protein
MLLWKILPWKCGAFGLSASLIKMSRPLLSYGTFRNPISPAKAEVAHKHSRNFPMDDMTIKYNCQVLITAKFHPVQRRVNEQVASP